MTQTTYGRHETYQPDLLLEILEQVETMATLVSLRIRRSTHTADQTTVYGADYDGLYQSGQTTKLRFWTRDREAEIRITGLTGNDVETFDVTASLNTPAPILQGAIEAALTELTPVQWDAIAGDGPFN